MDIYSRITITEEIERQFKPTRLCVKELNGLKYFCKSVRTDIEQYSGSGIRWQKHVKKYGKKNIKTLWISEWFYCPHHLQEFALTFSEYNQIAESAEWANLMAENGLSGGKVRNNYISTYNKSPRNNQHNINIGSALSKSIALNGHCRSTAISIDGIVYDSYLSASLALNKSWHTIYNWVKKGKAIKL
jgi:hypothetical protein